MSEIEVQNSQQTVHGVPVDIVSIQGYIDAFTSPQFEQALTSLVADDPAKHIVLDLAGVSYMCSTGYGIIMTVARQARESGGAMLACGLTPKVRATYDLLGMGRVVPVCEDRDAAMTTLVEQIAKG